MNAVGMLREMLGRLHRRRLVRRWRRTRKSAQPGLRWWITFTPSAAGSVIAWATDRPTPQNATVVSMLHWAGEAHFAIGDTVEQARDRLERELPPSKVAE